MRKEDYNGDNIQYWLDISFFAISAWILLGSIITAIACMMI